MEGNTGGERRLVRIEDTGKVFRMYCIACPPALQLFDSSAEILGERAVDGFEFASRSHDRNESGYPVNSRAQTSLALAQGLLGALALRHIDGAGHRLQKRALGRKQVTAGYF